MHDAKQRKSRAHARLVRGFTLLELLVVFAIVIIISGVLVTFQNDLFSMNSFLEQSLTIQRETEAVIRSLVAELRTASQSDTGGYPLEITGSSSLAFYANIDRDAAKERVHYFVSGGSLFKSVVDPAGSPLTYSTTTATESLRVALMNLVATATPFFLYYDKNYAGTTTPLAQPVNISDVRLVGVALTVDRDPARLPPPMTVSSQVHIRNLKDN